MAELPKRDLNDEKGSLAKIVMKHMVHKLYSKHNPNVVCITPPKRGNPKDPKIYSKKFPKLFMPKITTNKNRYPLY